MEQQPPFILDEEEDEGDSIFIKKNEIKEDIEFI